VASARRQAKHLLAFQNCAEEGNPFQGQNLPPNKGTHSPWRPVAARGPDNLGPETESFRPFPLTALLALGAQEPSGLAPSLYPLPRNDHRFKPCCPVGTTPFNAMSLEPGGLGTRPEGSERGNRTRKRDGTALQKRSNFDPAGSLQSPVTASHQSPVTRHRHCPSPTGRRCSAARADGFRG
jgi:hypothetical protein